MPNMKISLKIQDMCFAFAQQNYKYCVMFPVAGKL